MTEKKSKSNDTDTKENLKMKQDIPEMENTDDACADDTVAIEPELCPDDEPINEETEKDLQTLLNDSQAEITSLTANIEELESRLLRMQADFDNYRRRSAKDNEEKAQNASAEIIAKLLPVLDNFERAMSAIDDDSPAKNGVMMINKQLIDILEKSGLETIVALGEDFDPNLHEAVMQAEADEANKGKVVMEIAKGYKLNGRLLRPSMVQVGV